MQKPGLIVRREPSSVNKCSQPRLQTEKGSGRLEVHSVLICEMGVSLLGDIQGKRREPYWPAGFCHT
jgi:4'-phosphopantetheinyl transferase EntD